VRWGLRWFAPRACFWGSAARTVLQEGGYRLENIVHPFFLGHQLDAGEDVVLAEQSGLLRAIEMTVELGGRSVFMASGGPGSLTWEQAAEAFRAAIAPCKQAAEAAGIALLVENTPTLYAELNIALSLRDAVELAEMAGIGICLDIFSCWGEGGLKRTIERAVPRCGLLQVADYVLGDRSLPGRAVPGDGTIAIRRMLDWALSAGYNGVFDLELIGPRIDAEGHLAAARRGADVLGEILAELGV
jgi:sugar phosphate isomerase/epimerase